MTPGEFDEATIRVAEDQPEYVTIPARYDSNEGSLTYCLDLTDEEVTKLLVTRRLWVTQLTFGEPMQPIRHLVIKPDFDI